MIHEIYEQDSSQAEFELELNTVMESGIKHIVVEPVKLGDDVSRWIMCGNFLHKTAVISGLGCLVWMWMLPRRWHVFLPLGVISFTSASMYNAFWQFDPCCKYQVEINVNRLHKLPLHSITTTTPVVLVRKDDTRRKLLHNMVSMLSAGVSVYKFYKECS